MILFIRNNCPMTIARLNLCLLFIVIIIIIYIRLWCSDHSVLQIPATDGSWNINYGIMFFLKLRWLCNFWFLDVERFRLLIVDVRCADQ